MHRASAPGVVSTVLQLQGHGVQMFQREVWPWEHTPFKGLQ